MKIHYFSLNEYTPSYKKPVDKESFKRLNSTIIKLKETR